MGWPVCNTTLEDMTISEDPLWDDYTFHQLGEWIGGGFTIIAILVSFFLIFMHATHYLKPWEQRHIIRILFMVPVYAAVSFLSYYFYNHSVYFEVIRDCYEAFAIASFFSLLCAYVAPDLHQQKVYFRTITPKKWVWPMKYLQKCTGGAENGWLRTPRSGLTWFNVIWVSIFQYCFIRVFFTIVAVITQAMDRYCLESLNPAFSHIWVMVFESVAVTVAMYCLIQFYVQIKNDIRQHKPLIKVLAIKLVIFLSFWQTICISFLTSAGAIKATKHVQAPDIKVGIPALLLCIEMAIFAVFHIWAFSWKPYTLGSKEYMAETIAGEGERAYKGGFLGIKAIFDAFNGWDMLKATGRAARWLFQGRKHRHMDPSYDLTRKNTQGSASTDNLDAEGQKLGSSSSMFNTPTAYNGGMSSGGVGVGGNGVPARPPRYSAATINAGGVDGGTEGGEGDNLLANSQGMPMSRPPVARMDSDLSDEFSNRPRHDYYETSDIGLATSTLDEAAMYPSRQPHYQQPHPQQQRQYPPYLHPSSNQQYPPQMHQYYQPQYQQQQYQSQPGMSGVQDTGVGSSAPYPDSRPRPSGQQPSRGYDNNGNNNRISMPYMPPPRSPDPHNRSENSRGLGNGNGNGDNDDNFL
ncbi:hypothetical protein A1O1_04137 [Capronia coronata CBS 617.96]|uniref:DUF300-domain-containing protein n=1 Tax=Capronia coronata CBS 617.96 TaxID=1182541 RepID=W9YMX8_9EURO|nr:uncharacterized protein A1O1_04137 [Capronia coronata CBS 617.96]EXJ91030.1 hypothetical protein A1O1_04137 [Capronia coronata CBS 617.96]